MATKKKKTRTKKRLNADGITAGFARITRINLGIIEVAALQASYAKIHGAIKIPILFLYWDSPEEENRQLEKIHSTLNVLRKEQSPNQAPAFHNGNLSSVA